jgi:hypothetical protein
MNKNKKFKGIEDRESYQPSFNYSKYMMDGW